MANPRTPTSLKLMRGTAQPSRMNPAEPKPSMMAFNARPPAWLNLDPTARKAWHDVARTLRGMRVATTADLLAIALLCDALAEYVAARDTVRKEGATFESETDRGATVVKAHPAVAQAADAWRRARLLLNDYGLTAASRGKVSAHEDGEKSPMRKWIEGGG